MTVSFCCKSLAPGLVDVLHLIGVVSHARKIDQRQLGPFLANHANVQGLQAQDLQAQDLQAQDSQPAGSNLQLQRTDARRILMKKIAKHGRIKSSKWGRTIQESSS